MRSNKATQRTLNPRREFRKEESNTSGFGPLVADVGQRQENLMNMRGAIVDVFLTYVILQVLGPCIWLFGMELGSKSVEQLITYFKYGFLLTWVPTAGYTLIFLGAIRLLRKRGKSLGFYSFLAWLLSSGVFIMVKMLVTPNHSIIPENVFEVQMLLSVWIAALIGSLTLYIRHKRIHQTETAEVQLK